MESRLKFIRRYQLRFDFARCCAKKLVATSLKLDFKFGLITGKGFKVFLINKYV